MGHVLLARTGLISVFLLLFVVTGGRSQADELQEGVVIPSPIVHEVLKHEHEQFGYAPKFVLNVPSFDSRNRPYIRSRTADRDETRFVHTLNERGEWVELDFLETVKQAVPTFQSTVRGGGWLNSRIIFDQDDDAYTILVVKLADGSTQNLLLYSRDHCRSWKVYKLPQAYAPGGAVTIEHRSGQGLSQPPLVAITPMVKQHEAQWGAYLRLLIIEPIKTADGLRLSEPMEVTDRFFGAAEHSGGNSFAATFGTKTYIVWGEIAEEGETWSPIKVATYDRATKSLSEPQQIARTEPPNDSHNNPGVCVDSNGVVHVISGSHGENFYYTRTVRPGDTSQWTELEPMLQHGWKEDDGTERGRQTYLSFACDSDDTLHIAYRRWVRHHPEYHQNNYFAALTYQRKKAAQPWGEPKHLVIPSMPAYSIFYHKLAVDRRGRLYMSYSYWRTTEPYASELKEIQYFKRAMQFSPDGGMTWTLATTPSFIEGITPE